VRCAPRLVLAVLAVVAAGSCGGGSDTAKEPERLPDASSLIPTAPAPQPGATPTPAPDDEVIVVAPGGGGGGTSSAGCGAPFPPPVARFNVKVLSHQADRYTLDSTPLVGPDAAYCAKVGFPDRTTCSVRAEGDPQRQACEAAIVGVAEDTGRQGPTWTGNGGACDGTDHAGASCVNHSSNQYLLIATGTGTFRACAATGVCGALSLP
jgi:hypothetical protein